jgi:hypothetical protein
LIVYGYNTMMAMMITLPGLNRKDLIIICTIPDEIKPAFDLFIAVVSASSFLGR